MIDTSTGFTEPAAAFPFPAPIETAPLFGNGADLRSFGGVQCDRGQRINCLDISPSCNAADEAGFGRAFESAQRRSIMRVNARKRQDIEGQTSGVGRLLVSEELRDGRDAGFGTDQTEHSADKLPPRFREFGLAERL